MGRTGRCAYWHDRIAGVGVGEYVSQPLVVGANVRDGIQLGVSWLSSALMILIARSAARIVWPLIVATSSNALSMRARACL